MDVDDSCHTDFISELPQEIIEIILLSKLPIDYAVRTCVLSRSWRYKWASMTHVLFNYHCNSISTRFINGFMSMHNGPTIHTFTLSTLYLEDAYRLQVDALSWFHILCQKDVKEVTLRIGHHVRVPDCIFSCTKLTRLALHWCSLKPLPPSFAEFSCMKHLVLCKVLTPREDMERLISSCPLLESLTLRFLEIPDLTIRAPNLKCLEIELDGQFRGICLEKTPLLADVTVDMYPGEYTSTTRVSLENLLGAVPKLERLRGQYYFMPYLSARAGSCKFITYEFLKRIDLRSGGLDSPNELLVLLQLIFSSPNLQELYIRSSILMWSFKSEGHFSDWYKDPFLADGTLNQLRLVEIYGRINGELVCMELIKFLLERSPSLVMMRIGIGNLSCRKMRLEQLSSFPRASPKASVCFFSP